MCHYDGHANTEKIFKGGWFAFISHEEMLSKMVEMTCMYVIELVWTEQAQVQ